MPVMPGFRPTAASRHGKTGWRPTTMLKQNARADGLMPSARIPA
jgi:hypothetical protein